MYSLRVYFLRQIKHCLREFFGRLFFYYYPVRLVTYTIGLSNKILHKKYKIGGHKVRVRK